MRFPKANLLRSLTYRRYVAGFACFACGIENYSQACHPNQSKYGKGGGMKAGDQFCFPLCSTRPGHMGHHYEHDNCIGMTKAERDVIEDGYVERMMEQAKRDGRPEFAEREAA